MAKLKISGITIRLDKDDIARVCKHVWSVQLKPHLSIRTSVKMQDGRTRKITLSRFLLGIDANGLVVQKNRESPYDFRKRNLIICSMSERQSALGKRPGKASSKYKGVSKNKKNGTWRASIRPQGRSIFIGDFNSEKEAALAYNKAAIEYFGPYAFLNDIE